MVSQQGRGRLRAAARGADPTRRAQPAARARVEDCRIARPTGEGKSNDTCEPDVERQDVWPGSAEFLDVEGRDPDGRREVECDAAVVGLADNLKRVIHSDQIFNASADSGVVVDNKD